jgi:hypothetical protein
MSKSLKLLVPNYSLRHPFLPDYNKTVPPREGDGGNVVKLWIHILEVIKLKIRAQTSLSLSPNEVF